MREGRSCCRWKEVVVSAEGTGRSVALFVFPVCLPPTLLIQVLKLGALTDPLARLAGTSGHVLR